MSAPECELIHSSVGFWISAAEVQRDRVVDRSAGAAVNQFDAVFLAVAIRNVVRAAEWAKRHEAAVVGEACTERHKAAVVGEAVAQFDARVPNAVDVRDVLEHFDDYGRGSGRLQRTRKVRNYNVSYARVDDEYVLHLADGVELDVQSAVHAASELADRVQDAMCGYTERPALG